MRQHRLNVIVLGFLVLMLMALAAFYIWFFAFRGSDATNSNSETNTQVVEDNTLSTNSTNNTANKTNSTTNSTNAVANNTTTPSKGSSSASGNITVTSPAVGTRVGKTFTVSGFAKVFENVVQLRVSDSKGVVLLETFVNTNAPDVGKTGTFTKSLTLEKNPTTSKGKIEFFTSNEATGAEEDKISVAVTF